MRIFVASVKTYLYGRSMSERLSRTDWLDHGLRQLETEGRSVLSANAMAASLGVSRGSFYWHFRDVADFRSALLERWRDGATEHVISRLETKKHPADRLRSLLVSAFGDASLSDHRASAQDRAIRAWAADESEVARVVEEVDRRRVDYMAGILRDAGVSGQTAHERAVFLYWAYLGREAALGTGTVLGPEAATAMADLVLAGSN
ncbi:MAG: TetR/AcrR family transcriptional regulator [Mesorhizobium amorphae]|nr:MAG: TetR/AcrR family transcriptional regulator [Mesorhizobium amorphae]